MKNRTVEAFLKAYLVTDKDRLAELHDEIVASLDNADPITYLAIKYRITEDRVIDYIVEGSNT